MVKGKTGMLESLSRTARTAGGCGGVACRAKTRYDRATELSSLTQGFSLCRKGAVLSRYLLAFRGSLLMRPLACSRLVADAWARRDRAMGRRIGKYPPTNDILHNPLRGVRRDEIGLEKGER